MKGFACSAAYGRTALLAAASRVVVTLLAAVAARLGAPYDSSEQLRSGPASSRLDAALTSIVGPLANWDGAYMTQISDRGYQYEQIHAFFPFYPFLMRNLRDAISWLSEPLFNIKPLTTLKLSAMLLSNVSFVLAAVLLLKLGRRVGLAERPASLAAAIFCITPAGVFMSAAYTESVFAALSFGGMLAIETAIDATAGTGRSSSLHLHPNNLKAGGLMALAVALFACAGATRSNGAVLCGYLVYGWAMLAAHHFKAAASSLPPRPMHVCRRSFLLSFVAVLALISCAVVAAPYVIFQWFGYWQFCGPAPVWVRSVAGLLGMSAVLPSAAELEAVWARSNDGKSLAWCASTAIIPPLYAHVQQKYWGVGLFRYWQFKHLGMFVLAGPMLALVCVGYWLYFRSSRLWGAAVPELCSLFNVLTGMQTDAIIKTPDYPVAASSSSSSASHNTSAHPGSESVSRVRRRRPSSTRSPARSRVSRSRSKQPSIPSSPVAPAPAANTQEVATQPSPLEWQSLRMLPYVLHWLALACIAVVGMHVQVMTRFLAACPALYWMVAVMLEGDEMRGRVAAVQSWAALAPQSSFRRILAHLLLFFHRHRLALLLSYCVGYTCIGTVLFANFYNWT